MRISSFVVGLLLVLAGVVALMNSLGLGSWELARQVFRFWPVLLIVIGISLFWDGRIPRWLALLLVIFVSAGVVFVGLSAFPGDHYPGVRTDVSVDRSAYPALMSGEVRTQFGGGRLQISPARESWFAGHFSGPQRVVPSYGVEQGRLNVDLRQRGSFVHMGGGTNRWDLQLSPDIPWDVSLEAGAVDGRLDFLGIPLERLKVQFGAGDITLDLGDNGDAAEIQVSSGASNLKIRVPEDVGLRLQVKGALARTNLQEHRFPIIDEHYTSPNYDTADARLDIRIDMAVGNFELERYAR